MNCSKRDSLLLKQDHTLVTDKPIKTSLASETDGLKQQCTDNELNNFSTQEKTKECLDREDLNQDKKILQMNPKQPIGDVGKKSTECAYWEDKYCRLLDGYRHLQKVNQDLEDKLLGVVDRHEKEKVTLMADVNKLSSKLVDARMKLHDLEERHTASMVESNDI